MLRDYAKGVSQHSPGSERRSRDTLGYGCVRTGTLKGFYNGRRSGKEMGQCVPGER